MSQPHASLFVNSKYLLKHSFLETKTIDAESQNEQPVLFEPPRIDPFIAGGDLEVLYLEEIDVSDSHDFNVSLHSGVNNRSLGYQQNIYGTNHMASPRSPLQLSSPRSPRIFSPTMSVGYMAPQSTIPVIDEDCAPSIEENPWSSHNISVSNLWLPQEVDISAGPDLASVNMNADSVNMNVDSSDEGGDF